MKTWNLTTGIVSLLLAAYTLFRGYLLNVAHHWGKDGNMVGGYAFMMGILLLIGGIVSIVTRNRNKTGSVVMALVFGIGGVLGLLASKMTNGFTTTYALSVIFCIVAIISTGNCEK